MSVLTKTLSLIFFLVFFQNFSQEINWISMNEAMKAQETNPKNLILDVYTNWCGPCKLMDKNTFQNKFIAQYINQHYYAVKFNGEGNEIVNFNGRKFENIGYDKSRSQTRNSPHQFAQFLGVNAYPTTLFFDSKMNLITPIKGYLVPQQLEIYLELFKNDSYKLVKSQEDFNEFIKNFKSKLKG
jgi:thioredoxin-related protein